MSESLRTSKEISSKKNLMTKYVLFLLLGLTFVLRLYRINSPIIGMNSWRQADTAAISRNYHEHGYKFLYPQIDWGGDSPGYVETEFPIYSFVVALLYKIFGVHEFLGRLLSAILALITMYFLYLLVFKLRDKKTALWSCLFFAILPPIIFYTRAFQPESALIMSLVLGVYFFLLWIDSEKKIYFISSSIFISLACLLKIPSLYIGLPILYLAWLRYGKKIFFQWTLWAYSLMVILPVTLWYYHAHQIYLRHGLTFGIWEYGKDKWGNWDLIFTLRFWNRILFQSLAENYFVWIGFIIFIVGLFIRRRSKLEAVFDVWIIALVVYFMIVARGNYVHLYYQLPFMIPGVVYLGKVYAQHFNHGGLKNKKTIFLATSLIGICLLTVGRYTIYIEKENIQDSNLYKLTEIAKAKIEEEALIIAVDNNNPTLLYLVHKKGWHAFPNQLDASFVAQRKRKRARYILGNLSSFKGESEKARLRELLKNYKVIHNDNSTLILDISQEMN